VHVRLPPAHLLDARAHAPARGGTVGQHALLEDGDDAAQHTVSKLAHLRSQTHTHTCALRDGAAHSTLSPSLCSVACTCLHTCLSSSVGVRSSLAHTHLTHTCVCSKQAVDTGQASSGHSKDGRALRGHRGEARALDCRMEQRQKRWLMPALGPCLREACRAESQGREAKAEKPRLRERVAALERCAD